jgi:hypothetical protein
MVWLVMSHGEHRWSLVASHMSNRTDVQCRSRWRNVLSMRTPFDAFLVRCVREFPREMADILLRQWSPATEPQSPPSCEEPCVFIDSVGNVVWAEGTRRSVLTPKERPSAAVASVSSPPSPLSDVADFREASSPSVVFEKGGDEDVPLRFEPISWRS